MLRKYIEMKEKIKTPENVFGIYYIKKMQTHCVGCKKNIANKNYSVRKKQTK